MSYTYGSYLWRGSSCSSLVDIDATSPIFFIVRPKVVRVAGQGGATHKAGVRSNAYSTVTLQLQNIITTTHLAV